MSLPQGTRVDEQPTLCCFHKVGTVEEFMFKEGVRDILEKLDDDLVGLIPVKLRVRQIAALLVLDKVRSSRSAVHNNRLYFVL